MEQNYFLGLDMGTGTLGWAVTSPQYEILRKQGKSLWGVRLFENAETAENRRISRTSRRRLARRKQRLQILQELFCQDISQVDAGFFLRMKESHYAPEDKKDSDGKRPALPYALFMDPDYTDKDYHKDFPTIYHLRKYLMTTQKTPDIRLIYLALHHMMKHRGHFLFSGDVDEVRDFQNTFQTFLRYVREEELDFTLSVGAEEMSGIETILKDSDLTRSTKKTRLVRELGARTACEKAVLTLISGGTAKLSDLFGNKELDSCEKPKITFNDSEYEEKNRAVFESILGEQFVIIDAAKSVYDWSLLADILGDSQSISEAKIRVYEKHKADLKWLKNVCRKYLSREEYQNIFLLTNDKLLNYPAYIGMTKINGKKVDMQSKSCSKEDFYDFLKKNVVKPLRKNQAVDMAEQLQSELEKDAFLPKQVHKDNGVLPHQLHLYELKAILDNLEDSIPLLKANREKIIQLFTFRVPYYVGPLNVVKDPKDSPFSWAVRKSDERVYPWNFEDVIDTEASAENFIRRMTNKCTYLTGEDVLPKHSLLYSRFSVLNELNNLRLDGEKITVALKQTIYAEVFQKKRKVTGKYLKKYLIQNGYAKESTDVTGIDTDFKSSLTAYHDFKEKLTDITLTEPEMEQIILNITLFGEDKKLLKKRLTKLYPQLTEKQIQGLCSLSYKGWGSLSAAFLEDITAPDPETGEVWNIITGLWESNDNLMQLLSGKYQFQAAINTFNGGLENENITYETVENLYVSPSVKRQIWQTLKTVREIQKIMGAAPKRIFVEMAREKQESKRTETRKDRLLALYKNCREEEKILAEQIDDRDNHAFRRDKLYLYYIQKGRCMYSGEPISLEDLWNDHKYDIDHIYPQSKVMDDSLDNRVLVKTQLNAFKSDVYPIAADVRAKMRDFWKHLLDGGFISKEKYRRLIRTESFSEQELADFINRQLVETRQGTKAVAQLLQQMFPDTEIVYSKARNVTHFRQKFKLVKVRELNDLHHARDAYLNIVVGNTYFVKFTKDAARYVRKNPGRTYNLQKMFTQQDIARGGETAWKVGDDGSITTVKRYMQRNDILVTRRAYEVHGELFDQQPMKKGKGQVPLKGSDPRMLDIGKYGGYNKATGTYFMLVESDGKRGQRIRTIEYVPLYLKKQIEESREAALRYLREERGLVNPDIRLDKIKTDTLFKVDGFQMWLSGRQNDQLVFKGAHQLLLTEEQTRSLKKALKYVQRKQENSAARLTAWDELTEADLLQLYGVFLDKLQNTVYHKRLSAQVKTLTEKRDNFIALMDEDKCVVLSEILHFFQCNSVAANLKLIEGPGHAGILVMSKDITNCARISIIHQSITGVYEREIDLLKV